MDVKLIIGHHALAVFRQRFVDTLDICGSELITNPLRGELATQGLSQPRRQINGGKCSNRQVVNAGKLRRVFRTVQHEAPVLEDASLPAALSTSQYLVTAGHDHVE